MTLEREADAVVLTVRDNGKGFASGAPRKPESLGLLGLHERASLLEGEVTVESAPGRGTSIEVRLPMEPAGRQA